MLKQTRLRSQITNASRYFAIIAIIGAVFTIILRGLNAPIAVIFLPSWGEGWAIALCAITLAFPPGSALKKTFNTSAWVSRILLVIALALGTGTFIYYLTMGFPTSRMDPRFMLSPVGSVVIALVAAATLGIQHSRAITTAQSMAFLALASCLFALVGYMEGTAALAALGTALPMAIPAAILLGLVSLSALCARPEVGPVAIITSNTAAGTVARRLLLPLIALPLVLNFLFNRIAQIGWYAPGLEHAVFTLATVLTVAALVWWHVLSLYRIDSRHQQLESQAQQSGEQLRMLIQAVTDYAIYSLDSGGRINSWNPGAERIEGYHEDEILGQHYSIFFQKQDSDAGLPQKQLTRARRDGRSINEGWRVRKGGTMFYAHTIITRVNDPYGNLLGFAKVTQDISARRQADEEQAKLQSLLNTVVDPILVVSHTGIIETFNPAAEQVFGYSADEILGDNFSVLLPENDALADLRIELQNISTQLDTLHEDRWTDREREITARRKNGSLFPAELTVSEMKLNEQQKYTAIVRDITRRKAAEDAIKRSETRLSLALEAGRIGIWDLDLEAREVVTTGPVFQLLDSPRDHRRDIDMWSSLIHPDDLGLMQEQLKQASQKVPDFMEAIELDFRVRSKTGGWRWLRARGSVSARDSTGRAHIAHGVAVDIHERKMTDEALSKSKADLEIALKDAAFHLWHYEVPKQRLMDLDSLIENLGYKPSPKTTEPAFWISRLHPDDRVKFNAMQLWPLPESLSTNGIELRLRSNGGDWRWMVTRARVVQTDQTGAPALITGTCLDVTDRKRAGQRLLKAAQHDPLTDLPNRALTYAFGDRLLAASPRQNNQCAVLFVDLDRFKPINDTYGHSAGDAVLRQVAKRLQHCVRNEDIVGRLGGDEFLVVLGQLQDAEDVIRVARHCVEVIGRPYLYEDIELHVSPSIGISLYPNDGKDMKTLVKNADRAMYHAKESGRNNFQFFTPTLDKRAKSMLDLENRLRLAIEQEALHLHYQPVIDIETHNVIAVEALLRWPGEDVGPDVFIQIAETNGWILPLGVWVLQEACRQQITWTKMGMKPLRISVNVSPLQFRQKGFSDQVTGIIAQSGVDPKYIQLEITENAFLHNLEDVVRTLNQLRDAGLSIALDDFGKGYSSLNYLKVLPLDAVKVDKDFLRELQDNTINLAITEAIINLGDSLGLDVIAEGIETETVLNLLRTTRCRHMQGFYLSRPLSALDFEEWYRNPLNPPGRTANQTLESRRLH